MSEKVIKEKAIKLVNNVSYEIKWYWYKDLKEDSFIIQDIWKKKVIEKINTSIDYAIVIIRSEEFIDWKIIKEASNWAAQKVLKEFWDTINLELLKKAQPEAKEPEAKEPLVEKVATKEPEVKKPEAEEPAVKKVTAEEITAEEIAAEAKKSRS
jgi:hypothetical protein